MQNKTPTRKKAEGQGLRCVPQLYPRARTCIISCARACATRLSCVRARISPACGVGVAPLRSNNSTVPSPGRETGELKGSARGRGIVLVGTKASEKALLSVEAAGPKDAMARVRAASDCDCDCEYAEVDEAGRSCPAPTPGCICVREPGRELLREAAAVEVALSVLACWLSWMLAARESTAKGPRTPNVMGWMRAAASTGSVGRPLLGGFESRLFAVRLCRGLCRFCWAGSLRVSGG